VTLRAPDQSIAWAPVRVTCAPTKTLRSHVKRVVDWASIPDRAFTGRWFLIVARTYGQAIDGQTYSVSPSGFLRIRSADGRPHLFRRWSALCSLSAGILRDEDVREARVVAWPPTSARVKRRHYRLEDPISPEGNRTLREQLAELKRRPEAERAKT
jgi:hypothetical protein